MAYRTRIRYTATQKAEMWDRWQKGETLHSIARLFDQHHASVRGILAATGGMSAETVFSMEPLRHVHAGIPLRKNTVAHIKVL